MSFGEASANLPQILRDSEEWYPSFVPVRGGSDPSRRASLPMSNGMCVKGHNSRGRLSKDAQNDNIFRFPERPGWSIPLPDIFDPLE